MPAVDPQTLLLTLNSKPSTLNPKTLNPDPKPYQTKDRKSDRLGRPSAPGRGTTRAIAKTEEHALLASGFRV